MIFYDLFSVIKAKKKNESPEEIYGDIILSCWNLSVCVYIYPAPLLVIMCGQVKKNPVCPIIYHI